MQETYLETIQRLQRQYTDSILDDYCNAEMDELIQKYGWRSLLHLIDDSHPYRLYLDHKKGKCAFCKEMIPGLEKAIATIRAWEVKQKNTRWTVRDRNTGKYWASLIYPYWSTKRRCFLFLPGSEYVENLVYNTNKAIKMNRLEIVPIDATKRLEKPF
ncbi:MAG TPA: hypothetical protein V6C85_00210 [Allocoleopsis sp.]